MAEQKALALIDGKISEIPAGDTIRGAGGVISQLTSDPISPTPQSAWVRKTEYLGGNPIGLLLAITQAAQPTTYELRYKTLEGITVGVQLT